MQELHILYGQTRGFYPSHCLLGTARKRRPFLYDTSLLVLGYGVVCLRGIPCTPGVINLRLIVVVDSTFIFIISITASSVFKYSKYYVKFFFPPTKSIHIEIPQAGQFKAEQPRRSEKARDNHNDPHTDDASSYNPTQELKNPAGVIR